MRENIKDYNLEELKEKFIEIGEKKYRAEQTFKWLYKENIIDFNDMTNLSLDLRNKLNELFYIPIFNIIKKRGDIWRKSFYF